MTRQHDIHINDTDHCSYDGNMHPNSKFEYQAGTKQENENH